MESDKQQSKNSQRSSGPLVERLRPKNLNEIVGQNHATEQLKRWVADYHEGDCDMPHLLLHGPPGTGKSSAALALAKDLYGESWKSYTLDSNASDDRGIDFVRGRIKSFARTSGMGEDFNLIILDEMDQLTKDAQSALRRIMEDYAGNCRFVLCCNNIENVIPALRSRCARFLFGPLEDGDLLAALDVIRLQTDVVIEDDIAEQLLIRKANGSLRDLIQIVTSINGTITVDKLDDATVGNESWSNILAKALKDTQEAEAELVRLFRKGVAPLTAFMGFYDVIANSNLSDDDKNKVLVALGEYVYRTETGGSHMIQGRCFLRHFAMIAKGD